MACLPMDRHGYTKVMQGEIRVRSLKIFDYLKATIWDRDEGNPCEEFEGAKGCWRPRPLAMLGISQVPSSRACGAKR